MYEDGPDSIPDQIWNLGRTTELISVAEQQNMKAC